LKLKGVSMARFGVCSMAVIRSIMGDRLVAVAIAMLFSSQEFGDSRHATFNCH